MKEPKGRCARYSGKRFRSGSRRSTRNCLPLAAPQPSLDRERLTTPELPVLGRTNSQPQPESSLCETEMPFWTFSLHLPPIRQPLPHLFGGGLGVELLGIERPAPFHELLVSLVLRDRPSLSGTPRSRRSPPTSSGGQARSPSTHSGYRAPFSACRQPSKRISCSQPSPKSYSYSKLKPLAVRGNDLAHLGAERVDRRRFVLPAIVEQLGIAVDDAVDLELVQMRVRPAHRRLDVLVELVQGAVLGLDSPPDRRFDALQRDLELVDCCGRGLRLRLLALSFSVWAGRRRFEADPSGDWRRARRPSAFGHRRPATLRPRPSSYQRLRPR